MAQNRRQFIQTIIATGATAALPGCGPTPQKPKVTPEQEAKIADYYKRTNNPSDPRNIYNLLGNAQWVDQNGKDVDVNKLKEDYQTKFTTVTFGFGSCTELCPTVNDNLGKLMADYPNAGSFIVSVKAEENTPAGRREYVRKLRDDYHVDVEKAVILFPKDMENAASMQERLGLIVNRANMKAHDDVIILYAPHGRELKRARGMDSYNKIKSTFDATITGADLSGVNR
ncbi:MAG: SCO family protein [Rickettsiales bacterium]|nr:SCO family protein [Rickettsiales bacterium]